MENIPINKRKKRIPKAVIPGVPKEPVPKSERRLRKKEVKDLLNIPVEELEPHEQRKVELFNFYEGSIPIEDIFVDRSNGVELYRNPATGGWLSNPLYRGR